ncbi:MAG: site-2 protease family protein [Reyranella sp.]
MTQVKAARVRFRGSYVPLADHFASPGSTLVMMGWSLSLGEVAGTKVRLHFTFLLLIAWYGFAAAMQGGFVAALGAVTFILAVFGCVILHEYGHVLMARRFGIATRDITLLPIGGVATTERMPEKPGQELLVALAGPVVNAAIALFLFAALGRLPDAEWVAGMARGQENGFVANLALVNVMLTLFNLIPAFPMDGGRVLKALLSLRMDKVRATRVSVQIGQAIAFGLGFLGLFGNPMLLFIALFIFLAASHEGYAAELGEAAKGAAALDAAITEFLTLDMQSTVSRAAELLLATTQREFPVIDGLGRLTGVVTRDGMIRGLMTRGPDTPVADVMERDVATVDRQAPLSEAIAKLQGGGQALIGVVDTDGRLTGIITLENLAEYLMVAQASHEVRRRDGGLSSAAR